MHKLKNKFKRLFMSAATIGTACLLAGCGAGAAAGTDNSSVTESQSGVNGSEQENASSDSQKDVYKRQDICFITIYAKSLRNRAAELFFVFYN